MESNNTIPAFCSLCVRMGGRTSGKSIGTSLGEGVMLQHSECIWYY